MIDLHSHSTASDGTMSPSELVRYAAERNIRALALTDHDTTEGLLEAQNEAKKHDLLFIPGIEISIQWPTGEFHLLGLGLQRLSPELKQICDFLENERENRNLKMIARLKEQGIDISYQELKDKFNTENLGRPHFAQIMVEKGYVKQRQLAFDKYFAKGRPCYVERQGADLKQACSAILQSGGIPVQAHPLSMYVSWGKMEQTMESIVESGIMGLEAWHPGVRLAEAERLEALAKKLNIICTAGSDFHGEKVRADRHIGHTAGKKKIDDRFLTDQFLPLWQKLYGPGTPVFKN